MSRPDDISVDLEEAEWPVAIVTVTTPAGTLRIAGTLCWKTAFCSSIGRMSKGCRRVRWDAPG